MKKKIDLVCLTETWHKQCDGLLFSELTPTGYGLFEIPRATGRGGGIIVLYNSYINIIPVVIPHFNSFECFDLKQLVDCPTHIKGHTLDLVITNGSFLSQLSSSDFGLSDHLAILFNVDLSHLNMPLSRTVNYRKWKSIDVPGFSAFADSSLSCFLPSDPLEDKIYLLNTVLSSGLDSFAPMKSRTVAFVRAAPWYTDELRLMKAACRKLERR